MAHVFHSLIDTSTAKRLASEKIILDLPTEMVSIDKSLGRVLAVDIKSPINTPPFNRAIKDGFALVSGDVDSASDTSPVELEVVGRVQIGHTSDYVVQPGTCVYIPTGGVMPEGADSVVMIEYTKEDGGHVLVKRPVRKGENIALAGSDVPEGELIVRNGTRIGARELAVLSSLGLKEIEALGRIRIGIVSTGDELIQPGDKLTPGKIFESNGRTIKALIETHGSPFDVRFYGTLPDNEDTMREKLDYYSSQNDILIVSGSTSAGEKDMVYRILGEYDPGIVFHGIKIKPGKPTLLSMNGRKIIIGLPGFPVSAMMTFLTIFFPYILREAGISSEDYVLGGMLAGKVNLEVGKENLIPVSVVMKDGIIVFPIHGGSGSISRVLRADGYISVEGDRRVAEEGDEVEVKLFDGTISGGKYILTGEWDLSLDTLSVNHSIKVIRIGHYGAINSVLKGYSDVGGVIMPEPSIDFSHYNLKVHPAEIEIIRKAEKELGLVTRSDSTARGVSLEDILGRKIPLAVPSKGEGAYQVLMSKIGNAPGIQEALSGITSEIGNLNSVAYAVSAGYFPAGISDSRTAERYGLEFSPLGTYYYLLFCRSERYPELKFIENLMS